MLTEFLQDQAALYASGAMMAEEREQFELLLEFHEELRELVTSLVDVSAVVARAHGVPKAAPSSRLKTRILARVEAQAQRSRREALVVSGPDGLVQWVNPAFSAMCGYAPEELQGKNLGPILQGAKTDRQTVERIRHAVRESQP